MSPQVRLRERARVMLHMVMAFVIMILLAQLWLFNVTLDTMASRQSSLTATIAAVVLSFLGCGVVVAMIRLFLRAERNQ